MKVLRVGPAPLTLEALGRSSLVLSSIQALTKSKTYQLVKFPPDVLLAGFERLCSSSVREESAGDDARSEFSVYFEGSESWVHDNEAEFFADYRRDHEQSRYKHLIYERVAEAVRCYSLSVDFTYGKTEVSVQAPTRGDIEAVFEVFNDGQERSQLPRTEEDASPVRPTIFIGHGRNPQWRDLKDHLSEKHGYHVQAYETGARAGHTIRDILDELARTSSFALLVLTGEDLLADGGTRARQNVVHELGLFQGKLGFTRAIALLEDGTEEFSNIHGINQIRFSKGNIREVFGEVVATLRREFGAM